MTELLNWSRNLESISQVSAADHMSVCTGMVPKILKEFSRSILVMLTVFKSNLN